MLPLYMHTCAVLPPDDDDVATAGTQLPDYDGAASSLPTASRACAHATDTSAVNTSPLPLVRPVRPPVPTATVRRVPRVVHSQSQASGDAAGGTSKLASVLAHTSADASSSKRTITAGHDCSSSELTPRSAAAQRLPPSNSTAPRGSAPPLLITPASATSTLRDAPSSGSAEDDCDATESCGESASQLRRSTRIST
ncbi:hypothetical protein EON66_11405, partial [archaeon]